MMTSSLPIISKAGIGSKPSAKPRKSSRQSLLPQVQEIECGWTNVEVRLALGVLNEASGVPQSMLCHGPYQMQSTPPRILFRDIPIEAWWITSSCQK